MWSYTRHQLLVLLAAVVVGGGGVAVSRWRLAHPELAERIERFDHSPPEAAAAAPGPSRPGRATGAVHDPGGLSPRDAPPPRPGAGGRRAAAPAEPAASVAANSTAARPAKLRVEDVADAPPVDVNRAPVEELARLPGVGPRLAARIVEARAAGPFHSPDDLRRVRGLGTTRLDRLRPFVVVMP